MPTRALRSPRAERRALPPKRAAAAPWGRLQPIWQECVLRRIVRWWRGPVSARRLLQGGVRCPREPCVPLGPGEGRCHRKELRRRLVGRLLPSCVNLVLRRVLRWDAPARSARHQRVFACGSRVPCVQGTSRQPISRETTRCLFSQTSLAGGSGGVGCGWCARFEVENHQPPGTYSTSVRCKPGGCGPLVRPVAVCRPAWLSPTAMGIPPRAVPVHDREPRGASAARLHS